MVLRYARLNETEQLDLHHLQSLVTPGKTKLVSVAHVSNVLGCVAPVAEIVQAAHDAGALVLLDACQSVPHMPVNVEELGCDFLVASGELKRFTRLRGIASRQCMGLPSLLHCISRFLSLSGCALHVRCKCWYEGLGVIRLSSPLAAGHKMCGPTGVGFLWGKSSVLETMPPWQGGGEMIDQVRTLALVRSGSCAAIKPCAGCKDGKGALRSWMAHNRWRTCGARSGVEALGRNWPILF